jgi:hypothetical protein
LPKLTPLAPLAAAAALFGAAPAAAQMWFDTAAIMQPVVVNPCPGGQCPDTGSGGGSSSSDRAARSGRQGFTAGAGAAAAPVASADLTYTASPQRRRANLASFVSKTRQDNPDSAAQMEQLFASTDVLGQIGSAVRPYGYAVDNVGDAYAFWWMTAWEGARGSNRAFSRGEMQAVQAQAHQALSATPAMARASDAEKQEMAEAMWIQAAMIDGMVDLAKQQPELMPQLQQAVRQGARASGVDLDAMQLTPEGFVNR